MTPFFISMIMGLYVGLSRSSYGGIRQNVVQQVSITNPNPDPMNFLITMAQSVKGNLVLWVNYPDCNNYEGNKILFFLNTTLQQLGKQEVLDPHFSESTEFLSPFARFEPTDSGWKAALILAEHI